MDSACLCPSSLGLVLPLPGPHEGRALPRLSVSQCSCLILCTDGGESWWELLGDAGVQCLRARGEMGRQQWHHFGELKTHPFAFVSQRSIWCIMENLESIEKYKKMHGGNSHNPTLQREPLLTFWLILFKNFFFC